MSASESASRSFDPGSLTHDLPMFRTRTVICPAETLCRATLPKHTRTANRTGPSILPRQDRNSVLHTDLICFRSSMALKVKLRSVFVRPHWHLPPQFPPPSPLLNWLAKRHQFTAFVSLYCIGIFLAKRWRGRNEEHMIIFRPLPLRVRIRVPPLLPSPPRSLGSPSLLALRP